MLRCLPLAEAQQQGHLRQSSIPLSLMRFCTADYTLINSCFPAVSNHERLGSVIVRLFLHHTPDLVAEMVMGWVHPWVGLGRVGSKISRFYWVGLGRNK